MKNHHILVLHSTRM